MIAYTPEQLIDIGNREYVWCENEAKKAARELGFGDDWKKALEHVKGIYVPRGGAPTGAQPCAAGRSRSSSSATCSPCRRSRRTSGA